MAPLGETGSPHLSPKSARRQSDDAVAIQLQQFLDDWHFRIMHSTLGKKWSRRKCIIAALDLLVLNGIPMTSDEIDAFAGMDEHQMVIQLVSKMSLDVRENFEGISQQMVLLISTAAGIRNSIDNSQDKVLQEIVEGADSSFIGQQILKEAVIAASRDIAKIQKCQSTWCKSMDKRLDRLTQATLTAEHAQQQLLAVENQLESFGANQNGKSKKVLMGLAESNNKSLLHSVFSSWLGQHLGGAVERGLRKKFESEIENLEKQLIDYKERQLSNVKSVLMRNARQGDDGLMLMVVALWKEAIDELHKTGESEKALAELEAKLSQFKDGQAEKRKAFMARLGAGNDQVLIGLCFGGWLKFHADYAKDKEFEDAVKKAEAQFKEHMAKKKDEAKSVLNRMSGATDQGLIAQYFSNWQTLVVEGKKASEMDELINGNGAKFKNLQARQKENASGVQGRINEQIKANLLLRVVAAWSIETKVNHMEKSYNTKLDQKRKQLMSVQKLFKEFARQLEEGLGGVDGDSSGRTGKRSKGMVKGGDGAVSLPDIHARQVLA